MHVADQRSQPWLVGALTLAVFGVLVARFDFLVDDAFITFRYGRQWASGAGLVFNAGESPPVEGFSNFAWVAYCALLELLGLAPERWSRLASIACGAGLVLWVARVIAARISKDTAVVVLASVFFAALPPLAVWSTSGLETLPFTLSVFGVFASLLGDAQRPRGVAAGVWAALACSLRADGFVWVGIALAAALIASWRERNPALRRALVTAALFGLATTAGYLAFRWSYFGELAPNTARAKVHLGSLSLERGACYVASLLVCVVSLPLAISGGAARARRDPSGLALPSLVFVLAGFAYLIVVGGDWMMMFRMLVPVLPCCALLFAVWLASMRSSVTRIAVGVASIVLTLLPAFDVHVIPRSVRELTHFRWSQEYRTEFAVWRKGVVDIEDWIELGRAVALHTKPGESIVLGNIGAIGYYAQDLVIYDTHGLTNQRPFAPVDPAARAMPGHDRVVPIDAFDDELPTYRAAALVDSSKQLCELIPRNWMELGPDGACTGLNEFARTNFEILELPLDPAHGFRAGRALLLIKYRR